MKKIILISILFFIYSCGYKSVYKNLGSQDFRFVIKEMRGDRDINNLIKNEINLNSNIKSNNEIEISFNTKYKKTTLIKDSSGQDTDYKLNVDASFTIYFNKKTKLLNFNEEINVKNQTNTFEQDSYEIIIKENFASSLVEKLVLEIVSQNDN